MATVMGRTKANAATPTAGTRTRRISSVAYADDDRLSLAKTASAVGLPSRSCTRRSVASGSPISRRLTFAHRLLRSGRVVVGAGATAAGLVRSVVPLMSPASAGGRMCHVRFPGARVKIPMDPHGSSTPVAGACKLGRWSGPPGGGAPAEQLDRDPTAVHGAGHPGRRRPHGRGG